MVPFAPLGTAMPDGRTMLTSRAILGIPSEGMLCSAHELGLGERPLGIMVLPETATVGAPYGDAIGLVADVVFDLDVTRNRPDCHGHLGVARDLAAWLDLPLAVPEPSDRGRRARTRRAGRASSPAIVRPLHAPSCCRGTRRSVARRGWRTDCTAAGHAPDQQRGRRQQLRHARARTSRTTPTTSTPWAAAASGSATPRRGSASPPSTASTAC